MAEDLAAPTTDAELPDLTQGIDEKTAEFARGRAMPHPYGVLYQGPWETEADGVCTAVRRNAAALRRTGLPVFLKSLNYTHRNNGFNEQVDYSELPVAIRREVGHLVEPIYQETVAVIHHLVPTAQAVQSVAMPLRGVWDLGTLKQMRRRTIFFGAFENNVIDPDVIMWAKKLARFWVPCEANREWLIACGMPADKVEVFPHPIAFQSPYVGLHRLPLGNGQRLRFLNIAKWEPRKAQHELVGSFLRAFGPEDGCSLVLKSAPYWRGKDYPESPEACLAVWLTDEDIRSRWRDIETMERRIEILWKRPLTAEEMLGLYARSDVYVSAGRSEGYDLPAFDAKVAGLRMLHPGYGGPLTFEQLGWDVRVPNGQVLTDCNARYGFPAGAKWSGYDVSDMTAALLYAFNTRAQEHEDFDRKPFAITNVGHMMRRSLNQVCAEAEMGFVADINVDKKAAS